MHKRIVKYKPSIYAHIYNIKVRTDHEYEYEFTQPTENAMRAAEIKKTDRYTHTHPPQDTHTQRPTHPHPRLRPHRWVSNGDSTSRYSLWYQGTVWPHTPPA